MVFSVWQPPSDEPHPNHPLYRGKPPTKPSPAHPASTAADSSPSRPPRATAPAPAPAVAASLPPPPPPTHSFAPAPAPAPVPAPVPVPAPAPAPATSRVVTSPPPATKKKASKPVTSRRGLPLEWDAVANPTPSEVGEGSVAGSSVGHQVEAAVMGGHGVGCGSHDGLRPVGVGACCGGAAPHRSPEEELVMAAQQKEQLMSKLQAARREIERLSREAVEPSQGSTTVSQPPSGYGHRPSSNPLKPAAGSDNDEEKDLLWQRCEALEKDVERLIGERDSVAQGVSKLEAKLHDLTQKRVSEGQEATALRTRIASLESMLSGDGSRAQGSSGGDTAGLQQRVRMLESELAMVKRDREAAQESVNGLGRKLEEAMWARMDALQRAEALKQRVEELEASGVGGRDPDSGWGHAAADAGAETKVKTTKSLTRLAESEKECEALRQRVSELEEAASAAAAPRLGQEMAHWMELLSAGGGGREQLTELEEEKERLERDKAALEDALQHSDMSRKDLKLEVDELEAALRLMGKRVEELDGQLKASKADQDKLQARLKKAEEASAASGEVRVLARENARLLEDLKELQEEVEGLKMKLENVEAERDEAVDRLDQANVERKKAEVEDKAVRDSLRRTKEELDAARGSGRGGGNSNVDAAMARLKEAERERDNLKAALVEAKNNHAMAERLVAAQTKQIQELRAQAPKQDQHLQKGRSDVHEADEQGRLSRSERDIMEHELEALREEQQALLSQINMLQRENDALEDEIRKAHGTSSRRGEEVDRLERIINDLNTEAGRLRSKAASEFATNQRLMRQVKTLEEQTETLRERVKTLEAERDQLARRIDVAEKRAGTLEKRVCILADSEMSLRSDNTRLQSQLMARAGGATLSSSAASTAPRLLPDGDAPANHLMFRRNAQAAEAVATLHVDIPRSRNGQHPN